MMKYSTNDELEAIERSARKTTSEASGSQASKESPRRGSSLFAVHDASGELIVGFPGDGDFRTQEYDSDGLKSSPSKVNPISVEVSKKSEGGGPRRDSVVMQPIGGIAGLADFDDSDFEDSDEDDVPTFTRGLPGAPLPGMGGAAHGGQNHRPMVGGFAAAAYEAARDYHYQHQDKGKSKVAIPKRTGPPPSI